MKPLSICILGNSHVAALKQAWSNRRPPIAEYLAVSFFAAAHHQMEALQLRDGMLVAEGPGLSEALRRSSGQERLAIADYDVFVLVGCGLRIDVTSNLQFGIVEQTRFGRVANLVSHACFDAMIEADLAQSLIKTLAANIRSESAAPILMVPAPFPPERALRFVAAPWINDEEFVTALVERIKRAMDRFAARYDATILWHDDVTTSRAGFMRPEFNEGAVVFSPTDKRVQDDLHGNEAYGEAVLTKLLSQLEQLFPGSVLAAA